MIICGIDPGTRKTGIVRFDFQDKVILDFELFEGTSSDVLNRIRSITLAIKIFLFPNHVDMFFIEQFAMRGKAGEMLHKLIGAISTHVDQSKPFFEVRNTSVKKIVGGHGHCEKSEVALGVLSYFGSNEDSSKIIEKLILEKNWDILDAFAIAIAGMEQLNGESDT